MFDLIWSVNGVTLWVPTTGSQMGFCSNAHCKACMRAFVVNTARSMQTV